MVRVSWFQSQDVAEPSCVISLCPFQQRRFCKKLFADHALIDFLLLCFWVISLFSTCRFLISVLWLKFFFINALWIIVGLLWFCLCVCLRWGTWLCLLELNFSLFGFVVELVSVFRFWRSWVGCCVILIAEIQGCLYWLLHLEAFCRCASRVQPNWSGAGQICLIGRVIFD